MKLSAHFELSEFASHDGAPMPPAHARRLPWLCSRYLEPLRLVYGPVKILSGYRSPQHNRNVGGAPYSFHTHRAGRSGVAADVQCARGIPYDWYELLDELRPGGLGLYDSFVHVDTRTAKARW